MPSDTQPGRGVDRVAATGAAMALVASVALPFVVFRANRIVSGTAVPMWSAGVWTWLWIASAVLALVATALPPRPRAVALRLLSVAMSAALVMALGVSAAEALEGAGDIARVSLGPGAWLAVVGTTIVAFAGRRALRDRAALCWAIDALTVAAVVGAAILGGVGRLSLALEYAAQRDTFWLAVGRHLVLAGSGLAIGTFVGIPLGLLASRSRLVREGALGVAGVIQTVPSLALLGLLIIPLAAVRASSPLLASLGVSGIGATPAIVALTVYSLLPIVRNTYVGYASVDPSILEAGRGMGMGRGHLLVRVETPLALPLILEGMRTASVLVIGIATVTALVGAGGLGVLIFLGLGQQADDLTLLGAIPIILLAVLADVSFRALGRLLVSPGVRGAAS